MAVDSANHNKRGIFGLFNTDSPSQPHHSILATDLAQADDVCAERERERIVRGEVCALERQLHALRTYQAHSLDRLTHQMGTVEEYVHALAAHAHNRRLSGVLARRQTKPRHCILLV